MNTPVSADEIAQIRLMNEQGATLREVARTLGRAHSTISTIAAREGLTWDRSAHTAAATAAASADNKARRVAIVARLYGQVEALLDRLEADEYAWTTTTVAGVETVTVPEPPAQEVKALLQSISAATTSATKLESIDSDQGAEGARSMLGALADGLRAIAQQLPDDEPAADPDDGSGDA
ncbi:helix-turn-helix domain-containing protein [Nonomuraea sp. NN258]|uniref:helix-turn-helix domain-containing protein n=1 Tax=Nonomuraea antri TaxID=2730852 RepID=UPI001568EC55|nr:helix-turn-helix domain-containing protein [Nonomuraea antri]NRQ35999.1 helix-turn-helix domain-containing protein [Nonomuraea antri]